MSKCKVIYRLDNEFSTNEVYKQNITEEYCGIGGQLIITVFVIEVSRYFYAHWKNKSQLQCILNSLYSYFVFAYLLVFFRGFMMKKINLFHHFKIKFRF